MTNPNQELLSWAVENIEDWNDDYTHLRSDISGEPFFTTENYPWYIDSDDKQWNYNDLSGFGRAYLELGEEFSTNTPQVITKEEWLDGIAAKNAPTSSSEPLQGHVHAELMAEYALVAKTNPEPWKEFEEYWEGGNSWDVLDEDNSYFHSKKKYRRKPTPPKTMNIGGIVVEAWPLDHMPPYRGSYWTLQLGLETEHCVAPCEFTNNIDQFDQQALYAGKAFPTKEQAQAVADALNLVYNRAIGRGEG